ncbi:MAG: DUF2335 domain-containing protein [Bacteroidetes bacterium]|nr:MAG: DUF2335 domain-containing protein [Bacteroidota bacterium]
MASGRKDTREKGKTAGSPSDRDIERFIKQHPERLYHLISLNISKQFSGPLPPPDTLREYGDVIPGLPDVLVEMARKEQNHRHEMERLFMRRFSRGQWMGFTLGLLVIALAAVLLWNGQNIGGLGTLLLGISALIGSLVYSRKNNVSDP